MPSNHEIDMMSYEELVRHANRFREQISCHDKNAEYTEYVTSIRSALRRIDERLLLVNTNNYNTRVHCPKCFRAVSAWVTADELWLFGATEQYAIVNLYCRQCKGIRWRK